MEKIQEVDIGPDLTVKMPQDYISYVMLSWIDSAGLDPPIFPSTLTSRPSQSVAQDHDGEYLFKSETGDLLEITPSETQTKFANFDLNTFSGNLATDDYWIHTHYMHSRMPQRGSRYGLDPTRSNRNGSFYIDETRGKFHFSSNICGKSVVLRYISDGISSTSTGGISLNNTLVPKLAEEAIYKHMLYGILLSMKDSPAGLLAQIKKEKFAETRKAKLRLSNIKLEELTQILRGASKHIKH